jgi:hypothetical protein
MARTALGWMLAVFPAIGIPSAAVADESAKGPVTIEYVVRIVHLESANPIVPDVSKATLTQLVDSLAAWRKEHLIARMTIMRTTATEGRDAVMETVQERHVLAGNDKFRARFPNPNRMIPAAERRSVKVTLRGEVVGDTVRVDHHLVETAVWEPLDEPYPTLPQKSTADTTLSIRDGESVVVRRFLSDDKKTYSAEFELLMARIVREKP